MKQEWLEKKIWDQLATVIDPELGLNIVDMGLIYSVQIKPVKKKSKSDQFQVTVDFSLTTAGCPLVGVIRAMMFQVLAEIDPKILPKNNIKLNLVFDPPWTTDMMSSKAKTELEFLL